MAHDHKQSFGGIRITRRTTLRGLRPSFLAYRIPLARLRWWVFNFGMFKKPFQVAAILFLLASEQGFIGIAVYIACWVFMFPVMLVICIAGALFGWFVDKSEIEYEKMKEEILHEAEIIDAANAPRDDAQEKEWVEQDRRYKEAKGKRLKAKRLASNKERDENPTV